MLLSTANLGCVGVSFLGFCWLLCVLWKCGGCGLSHEGSLADLWLSEMNRIELKETAERSFGKEWRGSCPHLIPGGGIHRELEVWWEEGTFDFCFSFIAFLGVFLLR